MDRILIESIASSLKELAARGGQAALLDERRVRGKLADSHAQDVAARSIMIEALKFGVPNRLMETDPALAAPTLKRESEKLCKQFAADASFAQGAVTAWALALGLSVDSATPATQPSEAARTGRMIRCAEGHVFDSSLSKCPICGWEARSADKGRVAPWAQSLVFSDQGTPSPQPSYLKAYMIGGGIAAAILGVVVYFAMPSPTPPPKPDDLGGKAAELGDKTKPLKTPSPKPEERKAAAAPAAPAGDPATWPIGAHTAVYQATFLTTCPIGWQTIAADKSDKFTVYSCLRSISPIDRLNLTNDGRKMAEEGSARILLIETRAFGCPAGTVLESANNYCLSPIYTAADELSRIFPGVRASQSTIDGVFVLMRPSPPGGCTTPDLVQMPLANVCMDHPPNKLMASGWRTNGESGSFLLDVPKRLIAHIRQPAVSSPKPTAIRTPKPAIQPVDTGPDYERGFDTPKPKGECPRFTVFENDDYCLIEP